GAGALRCRQRALRHASGIDSNFAFAYSPNLIDVVDGRLVLTTEGRVLAEVRYPKTPDYYAKSLPDGTPYHEIVAFGTFITIFRNCQYWGAHEECKFCDINKNVRQMKLSRDFTLT